MMKIKIMWLFFLLPGTVVFSIGIDLGTAERLALESSREIIHARGQIELAALQKNLDIRNFLPDFDMSFSSGRQINIHSPDSDSIQLGLMISQPLFDGGRSMEKLRLAEIQLELQAAALENSIEQLRDRIWQLFYGLHLNREKLILQRELLDISSGQLAVASKKYEMGALTELDYLDAVIEVQNMELDITDTESDAEDLTRDFAVLLGFDYRYFENTPLELEGSLNREYPGMPLWEDDYAAYEQIAVTGNLELGQKRAELDRMRTEFEINKKSVIPSVSLETSIFITGDGLPLQEPGCSVSLKFRFPYAPAPAELAFGGGIQGKRQISRSYGAETSLLPSLDFIAGRQMAGLNLSRASEDLQNSLTVLDRSIRRALEKIEHKRLRLSVRRNTQDLQKKRLDIMEKRSAMGEVRETDLLQTRIEFYGGEIGIREEVMELMQAEREFEKLIGSGFGMLKQISENINSESAICIRDEES